MANINLDGDALTTADRFTFFKMMTSQIAPKYGAIATHMPTMLSAGAGGSLWMRRTDAR